MYYDYNMDNYNSGTRRIDMLVGNEELDFRNVCRTCLSTKDLTALYGNCSSDVGVMHMLTSCTFVTFYEDDGLPTQICNECVCKITIVYEFSLQCQKADEILRTYNQKLFENTKNPSIAQSSLDICNESTINAKLKTDKTVSSNVETELIQKHTFNVLNKQTEPYLKLNDAFEIKSEIITDLDKYKDVNLSILNDHNYLQNNNLNINLEPLKVNKEILTSEMKQTLAQMLRQKYRENYSNSKKYIVRLKPLTTTKETFNKSKLSNFEFHIENERQDFDYIEHNQSDLVDFVTNELDEPSNTVIPNTPVTSGDLTMDSIEATKKRVKPNKNDLKSSKTKRKPPYECKKCGEKFPLYRSLREHFKNIPHKYTRKPCPICAKPVTYWYYLRHVDSHKGLRPYICEICGKSFVNISNYKRHQYIHLAVKPFTCDICGKGFPQAFCLNEHRRIHTGERPFICYKCGQTFRSSVYLKQHLDKHEQDIKGRVAEQESTELPITCGICNQIYTTLRGFKTHSATHQAKHFGCSICGKYFVTDYRLKMHERYYHGHRKFACDICQKTFSMRNSFKQHMLAHSGRKDYSCDVCLRKFNSYGHIRYHMLTHTGEKPHKCNVCGKAFAGNGNLVVHMRIHTGETPYYCSVCQKGFYDSSSMKKHLAGHSKTK